MAITGYMESSLATSEVFGGINNNGGENVVTNKAISLIKSSKILTNEDIETAYITVRQISDSLTRAAMRAFDEQRVVLVYNDVKALCVTQALPFITFKMRGDYVTYVFVDKYISPGRDGVLSMQAPVLRDLLTAALVANGLKRNYENLATNQYLQRLTTEVYSKFFTRILNRDYSIAAEKHILDVLQYWINKFFLIRVYCTHDTPDNIEIISKSHLKNIDELRYQEVKNQFDDADPSKISELLALLKTVSPRMKTLDLGRFLSSWINYYYPPSMLAVDNIEYLLFMMITLLSGNNIISISASDIVKEAKNIKSFRGELLKLI